MNTALYGIHCQVIDVLTLGWERFSVTDLSQNGQCTIRARQVALARTREQQLAWLRWLCHRGDDPWQARHLLANIVLTGYRTLNQDI